MKTRLASVVAPLLATVLIGCAAEEPTVDDLGDLDDVEDGGGKADGGSWAILGTGVAYQRVNTGNAVLIAYGGYSAKQSYTDSWATELVNAKLGGVDVGHIYAVRGPQDAGYNAREISNTKLRAHLAINAPGDAPIYVVAHSSGSYVAHEMLGQLNRANDTATLARIHYANLDGGGSGLSQQIIERLGQIEFVYARDPNKGNSQNSSSAMWLADAYAPISTVFEVKVSNTGCNSGAGWCLHDVLITHRPHNPRTFDLSQDYTDFVNRPITIEYLEPMIP